MTVVFMNISGINFGITNQIAPMGKTAAVNGSTPIVEPQASDTADIRSSYTTESRKSGSSPETKTTSKTQAPEIVVMREKGLDLLVNMIDNAKESIDLHIYIVTANTPELTAAFERALERGVKVRLMIEDDPFYWTRTKDNPSKPFVENLVSKGAEYKPDNPKFSKSRVTHEKSMVFDGEKALILTGNLGSSTFGKNLDLGAILINDQKTVEQIQTIFNSDWDRVELPDMGETNLVISPDNARGKLHSLIDGASKNINILQQAITDKEMVALLAKKIDEGVKTELTVTDPGIAQKNLQPAAYLHLKGADVHFLVSPYIHAKAVTVDSNTKDSKTYVGSQNFSMSAIDRNRELGYIFHDKEEQLGEIVDKYQEKGFEIPSKMIITDPTAIGSAFKSAIRTAEDSIVLETCLFSDGGTKNALKQAAKRGVDVSVIMPENPFPWDPNCTTNITMAEELKEAGVKVKWSDPTYKPTAGTCMAIDGKEAITFPDNVSKSAFNYNNSYGVINIAPNEVKDIENLLEARFNGTDETHSLNPTSNIISSPGNARQKLETLIKEADSSIMITTRELSDDKITELIKNKAQQGLKIHILLPKKTSKAEKTIADLESAGVKFGFMTDESLHNNYIEIDKEKAYSGGHSLSSKGLDDTVAYGCMITHPEMVRIGRGTFSDQWLKAGLYEANKEISIEQANIDSDRDLKEIIGEVCKKGVRIHVTSANYDSGTIKAEFELLNRQLREMAYLDVTTQENKDVLTKYFGTFFNVEEALEKQEQLRKALEALKPGEELLSGTENSNISSKKTKIKIDGEQLEILPSRDEEIADMNRK